MTMKRDSVARLVIVRHAHAGNRSAFVGNDALRPLSTKGLWQAGEIASSLSTQSLHAILSSPAVRCVTTVDPIARLCGVEITELDVLAEGADPKEAIGALVDRVGPAGSCVVACSHGDVIGGIVELLVDQQTPSFGTPGIKKASIVELQVVGGIVEAMSFLPPPKRR